MIKVWDVPDDDNDDDEHEPDYEINGVDANFGTEQAKLQFAKVKEKAFQTGTYKTYSMEYGAGGRSRLLFDQLLIDGMSPSEAANVVKIRAIQARAEGKW